MSKEFIQKAFELVVQQKLENLEKAFPNHEEFKKDVYSYEKIALISLRYGANNTIGDNLKAAILDNDRFRAWFEIRHNTNKGGKDGAQKRRYYEAELFGLFNERDKPTDEEIKHILDTLPQKVPVKNGAASQPKINLKIVLNLLKKQEMPRMIIRDCLLQIRFPILAKPSDHWQKGC